MTLIVPFVPVADVSTVNAGGIVNATEIKVPTDHVLLADNE